MVVVVVVMNVVVRLRARPSSALAWRRGGR